MASNNKIILFIENNDSFSFNIINLLKILGPRVIIMDTAVNPWHNTNADSDITHLVIGPGPGNPKNMPELLNIIELGVKNNWPTLGICLGHQALGYYFDSNIIKAPFPMHGKSVPMHHYGQGLFADIPSPAYFTRYHSLVIDRAPEDFIVDAYADDDTIMAIRHKEKPIFGLQFHPESYLSLNGKKLLEKFISY